MAPSRVPDPAAFHNVGENSNARPSDGRRKIRKPDAPTVANPGFTGTEVPLHFPLVRQQIALPGLQHDHAVDELIEVTQQRTHQAAPLLEQARHHCLHLIASRVAQVRQRRDDPRAFTIQVPLEPPQLARERYDARLRVIDRDAPALQAVLMNLGGWQRIDPRTNQGAGGECPSQPVETAAQFFRIAFEFGDVALEARRSRPTWSS